MVFAILYGFFSGACECPLSLSSGCQRLNVFSDVSLLAPMISSLAESDSEIGARMGVCFTFTGGSSPLDLYTKADRRFQVSVASSVRFDTLIRGVALTNNCGRW